MNKELTPLEALEELKVWANNPYKSLEEGSEEEKELVGVIEKALKENAELKQMIRKFNEAIGEPQIIPPTVEKERDIKEELGVDLNVILKLTTAKSIFTKDPDYPQDGIFEWDWILLDIKNKVIMYNDKDDVYGSDLNEWLKKPLKDYGKTWALTKEELEK